MVQFKKGFDNILMVNISVERHVPASLRFPVTYNVWRQPQSPQFSHTLLCGFSFLLSSGSRLKLNTNITINQSHSEFQNSSFKLNYREMDILFLNTQISRPQVWLLFFLLIQTCIPCDSFTITAVRSKIYYMIISLSCCIHRNSYHYIHSLPEERD